MRPQAQKYADCTTAPPPLTLGLVCRGMKKKLTVDNLGSHRISVLVWQGLFYFQNSSIFSTNINSNIGRGIVILVHSSISHLVLQIKPVN